MYFRSKVSETITNLRIPHYSDNFSAKYCEARYTSLVEKGYEVGIGTVRDVLPNPTDLTESQKRIWILASTSDGKNI